MKKLSAKIKQKNYQLKYCKHYCKSTDIKMSLMSIPRSKFEIFLALKNRYRNI